MTKKKAIILISWIAVILWMSLIFYLSSQAVDKSDKLSEGITEIVITTVQKAVIVSESDYKFDIHKWNHYIRKCSHFLEYLILGILFINALIQSFSKSDDRYNFAHNNIDDNVNCDIKNKKINKNNLCSCMVAALVFCIIYSVSDEFHQFFVVGRGPGIRDVFIDSFGACVGIFLYIGIYNVFKSRISID